MQRDDTSFSKCLKNLILKGKENNCYITYQIILDTINAEKYNISLDGIDFIYKSLDANGIKIVDELPENIAAVHCDKHQNTGITKYRQKKKINTEEYSFSYTVKTSNATSRSCPEEALDYLLVCSEEGLNLNEKDILTVIRKCRLSRVEVEQLIEYLSLKGIEIPDKVLDVVEWRAYHRRFKIK
ncbi:MAG: RNA polymerase sigma factor region1.1 domain-containing protein [bacterium]|nr:hypothetical protein [Clostridiales bacterium]